MTKRRFMCFSALTLALSILPACQQQASPQSRLAESTPSIADGAASSPSATPTPQPTATQTPKVTPEPVHDAWFLSFPTKYFEIYAIAATQDGGVVAAGSYWREEVGTRPWIGKFNRFGEIEWQKVYGSDFGRAFTIVVIPDGGYTFGGFSRVGPHYSKTNNFILVRLDDQGDAVWGKVYTGESVDNINFLQRVGDDKLAFAGETESFADNFPGMWIGVFNPDGTLAWHTMVHRDYYNYLTGLGTTPDGGLVVMSWNGASWTSIVGTLLRFSPEGELLGDHIFDLGGGEVQRSLLLTETGEIWMGGDDGRLSVLDAQGNVKEEFQYDTESTIVAIARAQDGYLLASEAGVTPQEKECWLMKVNPSGEVAWKRHLAGMTDILAVSVSPTGNIFLVGYDDLPGDEKVPVLLSLNSLGGIPGCENILDEELLPSSTPDVALPFSEGNHRLYAYPIQSGDVDFQAETISLSPSTICRGGD